MCLNLSYLLVVHRSYSIQVCELLVMNVIQLLLGCYLCLMTVPYRGLKHTMVNVLNIVLSTLDHRKTKDTQDERLDDSCMFSNVTYLVSYYLQNCTQESHIPHLGDKEVD